MSSMEIELLSERVSNIDKLFFGFQDSNIPVNSIDDRVKTLVQKVEQSEMLVSSLPPTLRNCRDLIRRLGPLLTQKKTSLQEMTEKAQIILSSKDQLLTSVRQLKDIQELSSAVNQSVLQDTPLYQERLSQLETSLLLIKHRIQKQTEDIDEYLILYNNTIQIYSEKMIEWEASLRQIEST
mmetsp:Transcript_33063/g.33667  ORF Transcript_33063/g.33667 Transcript_33063/m.33667 type:complete len:181 (+) Transcript_33063:76-618(+)